MNFNKSKNIKISLKQQMINTAKQQVYQIKQNIACLSVQVKIRHPKIILIILWLTKN